MVEIVRPRVNQKLIDKTRRLVDFPKSITFNDSLEELLKKFSKLAGSLS